MNNSSLFLNINTLQEALQHPEITDEFIDKFKKQDYYFLKLLSSAQRKSKILKYIGEIDSNGKISIGLKEFDQDHNFARLKGTDNMVLFYSDRYSKQPLVISGPGAGPEVTAAGVFADILRLLNYLGK